jgi:hypothetical protein
MKRTEAERLYEKYTAIGAAVEFKFDKLGSVESVEIKKGSWTIVVNDFGIRIQGLFSSQAADILVDHLLTGKVE